MPSLGTQSKETHPAEDPVETEDNQSAVQDDPTEIVTPAAILELSRSIGADAQALDFRRGTYTRRRTDAPYCALPPAAVALQFPAAPSEEAEAAKAALRDVRHIDFSV